MFLCVAGLAVAVTAIAFAVRIRTEGGLGVFVWPQLDTGYEIGHVTRLAAAPWWLLFAGCIVTGLTAMLFGEDFEGRAVGGYGWWFALAFVPLVLAHLINGRRSRAAALLGLVVLAALGAYAVLVVRSWWPLLPALLLLLWSLNGVRATFADRKYN